MTVSSSDRRQFFRRPKLIRFVLQWRRTEEKVFTTDVSKAGMFLRSAVAPPLGSEITLMLPEARPADECITLRARVVRVVRRGDPYNPLGGVGIELSQVVSPRGARAANSLLSGLLGDKFPKIPETVRGPVTIDLPSMQIVAEPAADEHHEQGFEEASPEYTRSVPVHLAVFCKWHNMIIQGALTRLGSEQAILSSMKLMPDIGDIVTVRLLGISESRFRGLEFRGSVDQILNSGPEALLSLALNPLNEQPEMGGLRAFLRQLDDPTADFTR